MTDAVDRLESIRMFLNEAYDEGGFTKARENFLVDALCDAHALRDEVAPGGPEIFRLVKTALMSGENPGAERFIVEAIDEVDRRLERLQDEDVAPARDGVVSPQSEAAMDLAALEAICAARERLGNIPADSVDDETEGRLTNATEHLDNLVLNADLSPIIAEARRGLEGECAE